LGCGDWGKNLVRNFYELGALVSVVDPSSARRTLARSIAPTCECVEHADAVFDAPDIAGIVIATPAETHTQLVERALRAGKDVLCEKPLALEYAAARRLHELARDRARVLMVGHILEYHPAIAKLHELCASGELGHIRYLYSNRLNLGKVRREENILWSFAPHDLAVILRLVGRMPESVGAFGRAYLQAEIADVTITQLAFADNVAAHVFVSWLNPFKEQRFVVIGSRRMATFDDTRGELILHDQTVDIRDGEPVPIRGEGAHIPYAADEPLRLECRAFLEAIETRRPPLTDSASALRVLRVLESAQRSLITGGLPVALSDDTEQRTP
jgi:predicted dehydrogenase